MPPRCCRAIATSTAASIPMRSRRSLPRRRWSSPTRSPAPCASTSRKTCSAPTRTASRHAQGPLAVGRGDRRDRRRSVKPEHFRQVYDPMFKFSVEHGAEDQPAVRLAPAEHLHPPPAVLGRRAGRRAHAQRHAPAGGARRQHHHRPSLAVERDPARQRRRRIPGENGPAGRRLQFLRHPSRRPPHRAACDLRQPEAAQRDGASTKRAT